jgi:iron complex outermembrane recepter protein
MRKSLALLGCAVGAAALLFPPDAAAIGTLADTVAPVRAAAGDAAPDPRAGLIVGLVVDAETGEPLATTQVRLRESGRNELSHRDGSFHFHRVAPRVYTLVAQRIGYAPVAKRVRVGEGDTVRATLAMTPSALEIAGVVVTGTGRERGAGDTYRPTAVVGDAELRRRLASSVAATVAHVPGIAQRYNGPAAAQPVIRGMGGDRVLVLEDGQRTGDLSATAADHAVAIDPITASRIEVVRGPAGLLYGSNALGGVINVVREDVPRTLPEAISATLSVQGESVNRGATAGGAVLLPLDRLALRAELTGRTAGDTRTPLGVLPSTDVRAFNSGLGASWIASWGFAGVAVRDQSLDYGVPGEFNGELIPGAHVGGVDIRTRRRSARVEAAHHAGAGPFGSVAFDANVVHYLHDEIEGQIQGRDVVGAHFDNLFGSANLIARHEHEGDAIRSEGAVGLWAFARDNRAVGSFTGSRSATVRSLAGFGFEELGFGAWRLQLGARYDWTRVSPYFTNPIVTGGREVPVREREFGSFSGSAAVLRELRPGWVLGAGLARAFRTPSIEELYSDGPHLGDFSYDIGNPELEPEIGLGADVFLRVNLPRLEAEASVFRNAVSNYVFHRPTGERDPRFRRFPVFEARGDDARFEGAEGRLQWEPVRHVVLDGTLSWVRATRVEVGDPLPAIPPLNGGLRALYDRSLYFVSLGWTGAAPQNRVPRTIADPLGGPPLQPEQPTAGHGLVSAGAGLRWSRGGGFHTVTLSIDNLADTVWRDHLSRVKDAAPQPGRNVQLLYRLQF